MYPARRLLSRRGVDVYFTKGSPLAFHDLVRAGVHTASRIGTCMSLCDWVGLHVVATMSVFPVCLLFVVVVLLTGTTRRYNSLSCVYA